MSKQDNPALKWDLGVLFASEAAAEAYKDEAVERAGDFRAKFEGSLAGLAGADFLAALKEYEALGQALGKIMSYAQLSFSRDTGQGALLAKYQQECKKIEEQLLFFELEFCALDAAKAEELITASPDYAFYLGNLLKHKRHNLSEGEERVVLYLSSTGARAFSRLFDEQMSAMRIKWGGEKLSEEEVLAKLYDKDRSVRKKAARKFSKALAKRTSLLTFILNMIKTQRANICKLRSYESPEQPRHISNQISQKSVDALICTTEKNYGLAQDFYRAKKQVLGYEKLRDYDRYAPIGKDAKFSYEDSQKIILEAFGAFSPLFADIASEAFANKWIDVYPAARKQGGAFSHGCVSEAHPFILLNYTGRRRDLFTLAHELGHTIHQKLSYSVSYLNQNTPLTTAETASVFAEMLVFDYIKNSLKKDELLALYAAKIEDIFATLYRQINFTCFERRIHAHGGELSAAELGRIWMEESQKMFGEAVELTPDYELWWSYIPHFIHTPFYCYAYSYGQLLVLALYGLYKSGECENFKDLYAQLLSLGGSVAPKDLVASFGFDIEDEGFWELGIGEVRKLTADFSALL